MRRFVVAKLVKPAATRFGSVLAGALAALGFVAPAGVDLESLFVALAMFGVDLITRNFAILKD